MVWLRACTSLHVGGITTPVQWCNIRHTSIFPPHLTAVAPLLLFVGLCSQLTTCPTMSSFPHKWSMVRIFYVVLVLMLVLMLHSMVTSCCKHFTCFTGYFVGLLGNMLYAIAHLVLTG